MPPYSLPRLLTSLTAEIENAAVCQLRISFICRITPVLFLDRAFVWEYVRGLPPDKITHYGVEPTFVLGVAGKKNTTAPRPNWAAGLILFSCAVCGELKPVGMLSRLKGIKNFLSILEAQGVTRMERKSMASPVKEYPGPVLDHSCSQVCDSCRRDLRKGKVPRLALVNNLWIGRVPDVLKNLRYVEKILVARVRHTCAYVKVASGMRKMKANVVAFESPTPKIYTVLPPPRDDIDDVLAILFTSPSKPTQEDFARTLFLLDEMLL